MMLRSLVLVLGLAALPGLARSESPALPAGYAVHQSLVLDHATNGIDGA